MYLSFKRIRGSKYINCELVFRIVHKYITQSHELKVNQLTWKKHVKDVPELIKQNREIDMKVRSNFEEMLKDIKGKEKAVSLEFLKDFMHLERDDQGAVEELILFVQMHDDLTYRVLRDDSDQSIYIEFMSPEKTED